MVRYGDVTQLVFLRAKTLCSITRNGEPLEKCSYMLLHNKKWQLFREVYFLGLNFQIQTWSLAQNMTLYKIWGP